MSLLDRLFDLKARGTTVRTEVLAGATTFMTMAYIILVNPSILSQAGLPAAGVAAATCLAAGVGCLIMGLFANYPIALAPGMGLNAYFTFTVVLGMGVPWRVALGLVFISGVVFLFLTLTGVRRLIVSAIPRALFAAIAAGIGLFIAFIGLKSAGLVVANPATTVALGDVKQPMTLLALGGLALIAVLEVLKVRGGILIGIVATTLVGWAAGLVHWNPQAYSVAEMTSTAFQLDLKGALGLGGHGIGLALVEILFVFVFVDLFDNVGTLVAVTTRPALVDLM
ncbi:MAG TPA: NCS2 family permease, partial [Phenylobacterium sp.]|nr:NCS2 family permease [Phenylobacterium sp.]